MTARSGRPQLSAQEIEERQQRILQAALVQIAERGVDGVRFKDIANGAGFSVGTLQHYFRDRRSLILEALGQFSRETVRGLQRAHADSEGPGEALLQVSRAYLNIDDLRFRSALWLELVAAGSRDDYCRRLAAEVFQAWLNLVREIVEEGVRAGEFTLTAGVEDTALSIQAALDGLEVALNVGAIDEQQVDNLLTHSVRSLLGTA